jgi:hypothetical protein
MQTACFGQVSMEGVYFTSRNDSGPVLRQLTAELCGPINPS